MTKSPPIPETNRSIRLLEKEDLIKTGEVDHADWVYSRHVGWLQRVRFRMGMRLLPEHSDRLLEIGYGSGIFMPELSRRTTELCGVDPHPMATEVTEKLRQRGVEACLKSGSATSIAFPTGHFNTAIAISSLEFVDDIEAACREITRVLTPLGRLIVVTPGHSPVLDFGLRVLTGKSASTDYAGRREKLLPTLQKHFRVRRWLKYPPVISWLVPVYNAIEFEVRPV